MLNDKQVIAIKALLIQGKLTQVQIAKEFGVSRSLISEIATSRAHADVGPSMEVVSKRNGGRLSFSPEERNVYLTGEVSKLKEQNSILRRQFEASAKTSFTIDNLVDSLPIKPIRLKPYKVPAKRGPIKESAVLIISDLHADSVVTPDQVDGLEDYNFPVCVARMNHLVQETIKFTQRSLVGYQFQDLNVLLNGDLVNGNIHEAESYFTDPFACDLATGELIGCALAELSQYFPRVNVTVTVGNHGRHTPSIEYDRKGIQYHHDTLVCRVAELYCRDIKNLHFNFPDSLSTIIEIQRASFHVSHGHGKKSGASPFARAASASQKVNCLHKGEIDYVINGHFHSPSDVRVSGGLGLITNGAFLACDQFSYQALGEAGTPSQMLFGVHARNKVTWRLPITLENAENRYTSIERFFS